MKLIIDGTPEEIKKMLNTICGSEEHKKLLNEALIEIKDKTIERLSQTNGTLMEAIKNYHQ